MFTKNAPEQGSGIFSILPQIGKKENMPEEIRTPEA
jgi:hypothetical protein